MAIIHIEEEALKRLANALGTAGERYKDNLARLTLLINEITSGDIQGDPATDLLTKFQAKEQVFSRITGTLEDLENYIGLKTRKFSDTISSLQSAMK